MKNIMISIGNFLFKYRNYLFPAYIFLIFFIFMPPEDLVYGSNSLEQLKDIIAVLLAVSGLVIRGMVIGFAYIKRGGLNKKVYAENLVTEGMFTLCRNPLYFGNMLIYIAQFLMFGHWECLIVGVLSFWFIYECIIAAEENYLRNKFGAAYDEYCRDVPRWIPRFGRFKEATEGMSFDWKKAIIKDYSTIFTTFLVLIIIESWEILAAHGYSGNGIYFLWLGLTVAALGISALVIRVAKKREAAKREASARAAQQAAQ